MHHGRAQASNTSHCWQLKDAHDPGTNKDTRTPHNHTTGGVTLVPRRARCFLDSLVWPSSLAHTHPRARRRSTHHGGQWPFRGPNGLCHAVWHGHYYVFGPGSLPVPRSRQGKWVRTRTRLPLPPLPIPFLLSGFRPISLFSHAPSHSCLSSLFTAWSSHLIICPYSPSPTPPSSPPTHPHRMASTLPRATRPASIPNLWPGHFPRSTHFSGTLRPWAWCCWWRLCVRTTRSTRAGRKCGIATCTGFCASCFWWPL